jgi:hypothetical protein
MTDAQVAESFARHIQESVLPEALSQTDPLLVFGDLGRLIQSLALIHALTPADFLRKFGAPEWTKVSIDRQNLADRVSQAWSGTLKEGDQFRTGHDFPGKEKDLVIESRHPQARGSESRTQTRAVFNTLILIEHLKKAIRKFLAELTSSERDSNWVAAIRSVRVKRREDEP